MEFNMSDEIKKIIKKKERKEGHLLFISTKYRRWWTRIQFVVNSYTVERWKSLCT